MSPLRILMAEDDNPLANSVRKGLEAEHYAVDIASDGEEARFLIGEYEYDLIILDLNLPRTNPVEFLRHVHAKSTSLPVIALTARSKAEGSAKRSGLRADNFLAKPFSLPELSARVRELLRRPAARGPAEAVLRAGDIELNRVSRTVKRAGRRIELTPKEFALLECLLCHAGRRVSRAMIMETVWNLSADTMTNVVDVYIKHLRKKIDEGFEVKLIRAIRGFGYQLGGNEEETS